MQVPIKTLLLGATISASTLIGVGSLSSFFPATSEVIAAPMRNPCQKYLGKGYCTDYIRTRYNIPWRGNASVWVSRAKVAGWKTGKQPAKGAIAVWSSGNHVAIVESVSKDSYTISEWNWGDLTNQNCSVTKNFGIKTSRTILLNNNTAEFIYPK
jgi:surface antigen